MSTLVQNLMKVCHSKSVDEFTSLNASVKGSNVSKGELWKGTFKGSKIGEYLGDVFSQVPCQIQLQILHLLRNIKCSSDKKNKELFDAVITPSGIKGPKWFKKFIEKDYDMLKLLSEMFNKSSAETNDGFIFFNDNFATVFSLFDHEHSVFNGMDVTMADIDGTNITLYFKDDIAIVSLKQAGMAKLRKWLDANHIKTTKVTKATKEQVQQIKRGIEMTEEPIIGHPMERPDVPVYKKHKLESPVRASKPMEDDIFVKPVKFEYSTPLKARVPIVSPETLIPKKIKFNKFDTTLIEHKTPHKKQQAKPFVPAALLSDDYDLTDAFQFKSKPVLSQSTAASSQQEQDSDNLFVLKEWHESMNLSLESFFAQKQQEMATVKSFVNDKKLGIQDHLVKSLMPTNVNKLMEIVTGEGISKQRRVNMVHLKEAVCHLMQTWSNC